MNSAEEGSILLIENDQSHALLIQQNLRRLGATDIVVLDNGMKAVDYLLKQGDYAKALHRAPRVVLLDLSVADAFRTLKIIKDNEQTKRIPVMVLTAADNREDIARCYELGGNMYITKPGNEDDFSDTMRRLSLFLSIIKTPGGE